MNSISPNLNIMIKASEKASKVLIRDFGEVEKLQVSLKGPNNFVTNADRKVEETIIKDLEKSKKNFSILTEESGFIEYKDKDNFWIIDPIDGTTNFLNGVPHFCISIALLFNNEIIAGVIYDPIKDEIFFAEKNKGAFLNNQRIKVSNKKDMNECIFAIGDNLKKEADFINRKSGCAALDLAYVTAGRYDGYFQKKLNLWDIAAGLLLVQEAGGITNDINLKNLNNIKIIATNSNINKEFQKKVLNF